MPSSPGSCPFCGSRKVVPGNLKSRRGFGFRPNDVIEGLIFTIRHPWAFHVGPAAQFCAACAMVWSQADPKDAAKFVKKYATGALRARLDAAEPESKSPPPQP
jgi:hypothetical protein